MTARSDANRRRWAMRLGFSAIFMAALAFALVARDAAGRRTETVRGLVAPTWSQTFQEVREIRVTSAEGVLTIARGEDGGWSLRERGDYPVEPDALTALHRSLAAMSFSGARTGDPANHERLGVADPGESGSGDDDLADDASEDGGVGVRLTALDAEGGALEDWIFGADRADGVFLRRPDEDLTYAAAGTPPDIAAPAFWLDLDFLNLTRVDIAETRITPQDGGEPYVLVRGAPARSDFVLLEPSEGYELITVGAANGPGAAMAELRFVDVRPAAASDPAPAGSHTVRTFDGVEMTLAVVRDATGALGGGDWARLTARAADPADAEAVARAEALSTRVEGWLYALPPYAADRLIRPLDGIARPAASDTP